MLKRILVTGGCGFIGANLVPRLTAEGYQVRVLDNLSRGHAEFLAGQEFELHEGDIRDRAAVERAMKGIDGVIHLAAYGSVVESVEDPDTNFDINAYGTVRVLDGAKNAGARKLIFASTGGALIGDVDPPVSEDSAPRPKSPYGASKLVGEGYCNAYAGSFGLSTVMLRFGNIYGPVSAHKRGAVTAFAKGLMTGKPFDIYGDGSASRDFLYVDDLCDGILSALRTDLPPATALHLATGRETSVKELAERMKQTAGKPDHPVNFHGERPGEVHRNFANYERARAAIGFEPRVFLEEGLKRTWDWFVGQGDAAIRMETTDS